MFTHNWNSAKADSLLFTFLYGFIRSGLISINIRCVALPLHAIGRAFLLMKYPVVMFLTPINSTLSTAMTCPTQVPFS